jgi:DNA invertase Pin-like site-specific DNA recombinase
LLQGAARPIVSNGVNTVLVEDASWFARTLMVQGAGIAMLVGLGVRVMTSRGDDLTDSDDEMRVAMRQIVGVFSQLEKTRLVKKLKAARDRKRVHGKVEGRKSHAREAAGRGCRGKPPLPSEPEDRQATLIAGDQRGARQSRFPQRKRQAVPSPVDPADN